jgi:hypothetical protein
MAKQEGSKSLSSPKKGMNRDKAAFDLTNTEYSFMINGNFHDEHGSGDINLQNEPSNIYCSGFKAGFKVIGHKFDINADKTYFFLTNPDTGCSEIGAISSFQNFEGIQQLEKECDCEISVILENPLEDQIQVATCHYETIISDYCELLDPPACTGCLGFDINFPIHESNIHLKDESSGRVLYWTDFKNPQRYLQLDRLEIYTQDTDDCTGDVVTTCLNCEKMRIFQLYNKPCIEVATLLNGGNLRAGTYEALVAYSTQTGEEISDYYALTNPIPIYDRNNNVLDQTNLDYLTDFSIKLNITDLDTRFEYYKLAIIYRNGLDGAISVKQYGIFPIGVSSVSVSTLTDKPVLVINDVLSRRVVYERARGMASGNGYLFQYGMEAHREINLQQVVNLLGSMVKWNTVIAEEEIYKDGAQISNYLSYMRDEVAPLSIRFFEDGGYETATFPLIPRPPTDFELEELGDGYPIDDNNESILANNPSCSGNERNKRWQFENTAESLGYCEPPPDSPTGNQTIEVVETQTCFVELDPVVDIPAGQVNIGDTPTSNLVAYINDNSQAIQNGTYTPGTSLYDIQQILLNPASGDCTPSFADTCGPLSTPIEEMIAISVSSESTITVSIPFEEYPSHPYPPECSSLYQLNSSGFPTNAEDTIFMDTYMRDGEVVWFLPLTVTSPSPYNYVCENAPDIPQFIQNPPPGSVNNGLVVELEYQGAISTISIADGNSQLQHDDYVIPASGINIPDGFTDRLHTNARFYKLNLEDALLEPVLAYVVELTQALSQQSTDDMCQEFYRFSIFADCPSIPGSPQTAIASVIIDAFDPLATPILTVFTDPDFSPGNEAYIAIDSPIYIDAGVEITLVEENPSEASIELTGDAGDASITIGGFNYPFSYNSSLTQTADDFVANNGAQITIDTPSLSVTAALGVLTFTWTGALGSFPSITIANGGVLNLDGFFNPPCDSDNLVIQIDHGAGLVDYEVPFTNNLTDTADLFVTTWESTLVLLDILVTADMGVLSFRMTPDEAYSVIVIPECGTIGASIVITTYHTLRPICGCFSIWYRDLETSYAIDFVDLVFGKNQTYTSTCEYLVPELFGCDPIPYQYGLFSHWESIEKYPCTEELWDSSSIKINPLLHFTELSALEVEEFENYYVSGGSAAPTIDVYGNYVLLEGTDFRDAPIRHYKFPCSVKVPFMSFANPGAFKDSVIYPIGFSLSNTAINAFLEIAVTNGLLTEEEKLKISKYEIFRGDRSVDKSIIAKGMLFDMRKYIDAEVNFSAITYYPNYPLNGLGNDILNKEQWGHPYSSTKNNIFTFHSPDTSFHKPSLPREMKVEGYQYGKSGTYFDKVLDYPSYVILGNRAYAIATAISIAEVLLDLILKGLEYTMGATSAGTVFGIAGTIIVVVIAVLALIGGMFKVGQLRYQWLEIFRNLGHPYDFAYYSATSGHYNYLIPNNSLPADVSRGIAKITYLDSGRFSVPNEVTGDSFLVNNLDREKSVFVSLGDNYFINYPPEYINYDNSNNADNSSTKLYSSTGASNRIIGNAASPYASLKQYLPAQYGSIQSVDWIHTGFCGDINDNIDCNPIFGGDTYISRFSVKRKFPHFTANSHGLAPRTPFKHSDYPNVWPGPKYYLNYLIDDDVSDSFAGFVFPDNRSSFEFYPSVSTGNFYVKPPGKFFIYSYGFPYFLVESVINCNFRYAKKEPHENFYPNTRDLIGFTQESKVSIREPNTYFYNNVYSGLRSKYAWRLLPDNYNEELYRGLTDLTNTTIYSGQDNSEASLTDPWLLYKALDSYTFPKAFGKLIDMDSIESEAILARFENGVTLFGAIDQMRDRLTPETGNIGSGGIFAGRSLNFNKTDLGYGGTQHITKVSCEFGHFWADAKRGQVFHMKPNGEGFNEITTGVQKWFKENLPFRISEYVSGLDQRDLDNTFKGLGITMGWDSRLKRVFLTKLDYKPLRDDIQYNGEDFYYENLGLDIIVKLTDSTFFEDCSFTIAFSPLTATWISYYSFKPSYYIAYNNYFQTGVNYAADSSEEGLWSHLPFLSSYQVFYGKLYPWIIEETLPSKFMNSNLEDIEYWMDVRKYYNKYDFANVYGYGFNKAFIYNSQQNSGQLNLIHQKDNDLRQEMAYPNYNTSSIDILQSEINGKWSFNYLYNLIRNEKGGLPIWIYDCNQIMKSLDNRLLDYRSSYKDRLRGDYFILRLQQDQESRFKMIHRFDSDERNYYKQ